MKKRNYKGSVYIRKSLKKRKKDAGVLQSALLHKVLVCLVIFGVLFVFLFGSKRYVSAQPKFKTNLEIIDLVGGDIHWAKGKAKKVVLKSVEKSITVYLDENEVLSLLDTDIVKKVYTAVASSPWVSETWEVKKVYPNKIVARYEVRKPRVAVVAGDFIVCLDKEGIILPLFFSDRVFKEFNQLLMEELRVVVGLNAEVVELPDGSITIETDRGKILYSGDKWEDDRISSALTVNNSLDIMHNDSDFRNLHFTAISVENIDGRKNLLASEIIINANVCINTSEKNQKFISIWWGRDKNHAGFGENKVKDKIEMLRSIIKKQPSLKNISKIDLRFPIPEFSPVYKYD